MTKFHGSFLHSAKSYLKQTLMFSLYRYHKIAHQHMLNICKTNAVSAWWLACRSIFNFHVSKQNEWEQLYPRLGK